MSSTFRDERQWYVVYSKPRKEDVARFHLELKGLEVFLPKLLLPLGGAGGGRIVPLFPSYLFVRIKVSEEYHYVLWSPGVKSFVAFDGNPAPVEDRVVALLMRQAAPEGFIRARCNLQVGQEVQISGGPFEGLMGIIQEPPNGKERVKVLLKLLSRQVKVEVPLRFVKSEWVLCPSA